MNQRALSLVVCLGLGVLFNAGAGCTEVPSRKVLPQGFTADASFLGNGGQSQADSGTGGSSQGGSGGGQGGQSAGGGGGQGGTDGGSSEGGGTIVCGGSPCHGFKGFGVDLEACCAGPNQEYCGMQTIPIGGPGCLELNQPGNADATCPTQTQGGTQEPGCCLDRSSTCGVQFAVPGGPNFGCVDLQPFGSGTVTPCTRTCSATKGPCTYDSDCCDASPKTVACINAGGTGVCSYYCTKNSDCASDCCTIIVDTGRGVCAPDASYCPQGCGTPDTVCETDADCCTGNVCVATGAPGPRLCRPSCTTSQECNGEQCLPDALTSKLACARPGGTLCSDSCRYASNGYCEDGGPGSGSADCALGTDCTDCKNLTQVSARIGGTRTCFDDCGTAHNNICEDGGPGSTAYSCGFGADCADCGPRLGICTDDCYYAHDGVCDDGSANAATASCAPGTDCSDCGVQYVGRRQWPCDGSTGTYCLPRGSQWAYRGGIDNTCECADCAWDAHDCGITATYCDGASISSTCATTNPNAAQSDGVCQCGGWCEWDKVDCGAVGGPKCDGKSVSSYCTFPGPATGEPDAYCDCGGVCSWEGNDCSMAGTQYLCTDTCTYAGDGTCDDDTYCTRGTDCADCGPRDPFGIP